MTLTMTQKVIKIGDSAGITIPAKELKRAGIMLGDEVEVIVKTKVASVDAHTAEVVKLTQKLIARHKAALVNLSQR